MDIITSSFFQKCFGISVGVIFLIYAFDFIFCFKYVKALK